jgi:murein L,D-transpeptidase YcbB/YkuD
MTPRIHSNGALRGAVFFSAVLSLAACARKPEPRDPVVQARREVAKVFESAEPYSAHKVQDADLTGFLANNQEYAADSATIAEFYRDRDMQHAWVLDRRISASAESFVMLAGLTEGRGKKSTPASKRMAALYDAAIADGKRVELSDESATELELRLTAEFFRFAATNYGGYLNTDVRDLNWFIPRAKMDFAKLLDSVSAGKMDLSGYQPPHPQFKQLQSQLGTYASLAKQPWPELAFPAKRTKLKVGDSASVVPEMRRRLGLLGDYSGDTAGLVYDSALVNGVKKFQTRHGMIADGVIDAAMLSALNVLPAARMRTMLINMERLRWVSGQQPPNLLLVNIPEFRLHIFENGSEVESKNVVVGARATRTVTFTDTLTEIVFSPSWSIPSSIVRNEILPAMAKDRSYLAKHNMEITGGSAAEPDIRQKPGPSNALGRVKFLFPNSYSIYMHDTPAKGLFAGEKRAASHGCIRVSNADEFAVYLLRNDPEWPQDRIDAAMFSGREQTVKLKEPRPVAIVYFTAWVDPNGELNFRDDIYGHDRELAEELFARGGAASPATVDSGR